MNDAQASRLDDLLTGRMWHENVSRLSKAIPLCIWSYVASVRVFKKSISPSRQRFCSPQPCVRRVFFLESFHWTALALWLQEKPSPPFHSLRHWTALMYFLITPTASCCYRAAAAAFWRSKVTFIWKGVFRLNVTLLLIKSLHRCKWSQRHVCMSFSVCAQRRMVRFARWVWTHLQVSMKCPHTKFYWPWQIKGCVVSAGRASPPCPVHFETVQAGA